MGRIQVKELVMKKRAIKNSGFTLIELIVTMLIVAILSSIAFSMYQHSIIETKRTQAKTALMDLASREQKLYATTNLYSANPADLGYSGSKFPMLVGDGYYQVDISVVPATVTVPASFSLTATPVGPQANDTECASFGLNSLGQQTATNTAGQNTASSCW